MGLNVRSIRELWNLCQQRGIKGLSPSPDSSQLPVGLKRARIGCPSRAVRCSLVLFNSAGSKRTGGKPRPRNGNLRHRNMAHSAFFLCL